MNFLIALLLCALAAGFEGLCAGRDPMGDLRTLNQPSWALPNWAWVLVGIGWYGICFVSLARLLSNGFEDWLALLLLIALLIANGAANLFTFRMKRLDLGFYFLFPYWVLLGIFLYAVWPVDRLAFGLFAIYAAYQLYAAIWSYRLWELNPGRR